MVRKLHVFFFILFFPRPPIRGQVYDCRCICGGGHGDCIRHSIPGTENCYLEDVHFLSGLQENMFIKTC